MPNRVLPLLILPGLLCSSLPAGAQHDPGVAARRALVEREQQSEMFSLQLRQSQQKAPLGADERRSLDALHREQLHRLELLGQDELRQTTSLPGYDLARRQSDRQARLLQSGSQAPAWGPRLQSARHWTPSAERPERPWTPTLE